MAIHYLSAVVLPFISGCHTVWGCFVNFQDQGGKANQGRNPKLRENCKSARQKSARVCNFFEVSGFLLDLLCFLDLEKFTKHPHTVWQPLINGSTKVVIFGEIVVPFVVRAPSACVVFVWCFLVRSESRRRLLGLVWVASCAFRVAR